MDGLKAMHCLGWNLTMPLKTAIIPYLDELSEASTLSHSVNTVVNDGGRLIGHTTDGVGYMDSLKDAGFSIDGGAATSICTQAALDGVKEIFLFKRKNATFAKTGDFADKISKNTSCRVTLCDLSDQELLQKAIASSDLLVNATNVGMDAQPFSLVPKKFLRPDLIVSDIIYYPAMTPLLADAAEIGCPYFNGKYMLLYQGAQSFFLWTGKKMPTEKIKEMYFAQEDQQK